MEKEQLKVFTKTQRLNLVNPLHTKAEWYRLMMLEGLDEAVQLRGEGGTREGIVTTISLLALDPSLEANSGFCY